MPEFVVCSKSQVKATVKRFQATHLLSTLDVGDRIFRPLDIDPKDHLRLNFDDEDDPAKTHAPQLWHANAILVWGQELPPDARVVVHCFAGQCRSTAAGLALWLQANGKHRLDEASSWLLDHRPTACPNMLMARHFDQLMHMDSAFVQLCDRIGQKGIARWLGKPDSH